MGSAHPRGEIHSRRSQTRRYSQTERRHTQAGHPDGAGPGHSTDHSTNPVKAL